MLLMTIPAADETPSLQPAIANAATALPDVESADEDNPFLRQPTRFGRLMNVLLGAHGIFSHFPIVAMGLAGAVVVIHGHWPAATKALAAVTLAAALWLVISCLAPDVNWEQPMLSAKWFVIFLPLLMFWSGVWLARRHHAATWSVLGVLLAFSITIGIIGAASPMNKGRAGEYTPYTALKQPAKVPTR